MIYHLYSQYEPSDPESKRRHRIARLTWENQPWTEMCVPNELLPRVWSEEGKSLPYIRDLFDKGCAGAQADDIIVYTNADILVHSECCLELSAALQMSDAVYAYRRDFHHRMERPIADIDYPKGTPYAGSDLAAFRVSWWLANREAMPDMIIGFEAYDPVLRTLIDQTNPPGPNVIPDIIAHERHYSWWEDSKNRYRLKGQLVNLALAKSFLQLHGVNPRSHGIP